MVTIAGFAGNRGRNLLNLDDLEPGGATLEVIVTNHTDAPIIEAAATRGIATIIVERDDGEERQQHEARILDELEPFDVDLVCLDGYMRILSGWMLEQLPTTLNVHPSLLPLFKGMDAWGDALDAGVRVSGCTVHVATDVVDEGPIITQEPVPVRPDDTVGSLKERILYEGEFKAYPRAVQWIAEEVIEITENSEGEPAVSDTAVDESAYPAHRLVSEDRIETLRYGENPHQTAALYGDYTVTEPNLAHGEQISGDKGMSYVNYVDAAGALDIITEFEEPAAAVIKHAAPAGCATAYQLDEAYDRALSTDPMSAFGGIVSLNRPCDVSTAEQIVESVKDIVVTPGVEADALDVLGERSNMRVIDVSGGIPRPIGPADRTVDWTMKPIVGGTLIQDRDQQRLDPEHLEVVTEEVPTEAQLETMAFGWSVAKHALSNAIVLADGTETVGIGQGQVSRVDAVHLAIRKAREHAEGKGPDGSVLISDAFFPFPDGVELAASAGIDAIVQPGGSRNDDTVIEAADEHGIAMAFTGQRCFRH